MTVLHLSRSFMTLTLLKSTLVSYFVECPSNGFVWCFLTIKLRLWVLREITLQRCSALLLVWYLTCRGVIPPRLIRGGVTWLRWCLPGFSTINLLCFPSPILSESLGPVHTQGEGIKLQLLENRVSKTEDIHELP